MPKFRFTALATDASEVAGIEVAATIAEARSALRQQGLQTVSLREKRSVWQLELTKRKVPPRDLMHFSRQLAVFLRAGIPILDALEIINSEVANKLLSAALDDVGEQLRSGATFAAAAASHPEAFPPFYLGIVRSAELTGKLDVVLDDLAEYLERDIEARQKVVSALVYPAIVLVMSLVAVVVLTVFVLPRFETFFGSFDAELPLPTRMLLAITHFLSTWGPVLGVGLLVVGVGGGWYLRSAKGRPYLDRALLRIPVVGDLLTHAIVERFCRVFASMMSAGVPVPDALAVIGEATSNTVYRDGLAQVRDQMLRGEGLAGPLAESDLFPSSAKQMFRVGEDTGTLDEQLATAAKYFDRELDYRLKRFTALFEPAVILFVGVVVGFVAIALVSAMYGVYNQVDV